MMKTAFPETTVIDIAPLFGDVRDPGLDRHIAAVLEAEGSLVATGFPGSPGHDRRVGELLSFFAMPLDAKMACATQNDRPDHPNIYRGYYPLPDRPHFSHHEIFDIGPEPAMTSPDVPGAQSFREANVWPDAEPFPRWREHALALFADERRLGVAIMAAAARGLGLDEEAVAGPARGRNGTLRLLHYAPLPEGYAVVSEDGRPPEEIADGRRLVGSAHIDTGLVSVLWQDRMGGLQMQGPDGVWREVAMRQDAVSVHMGDLMHGLTGGRLSGTRHRVLSRGFDRCSVGLFVEPDFETPVVAPSGGAPVSYARHLVNEFPARFEPKRAA
jgi:isopenicillin N synthase-like dioxygenase